ncbi:STAS domain-containing protein [Cellulomonas marina]|uniref:Anti-anti-sigma factor n=1 Tax=Cellulomonas marina TaxID=988821 RepID=A0A1I0XZF9_9CELL|nr:STAS domain-containing protein [Cellulomonas marina]GIG28432.1 hypothetical protein Cma02nite_10320 [Cellulomonas marina]SFB06431.1 anti-anti-sigma factor [Cellulomonas marina]
MESSPSAASAPSHHLDDAAAAPSGAVVVHPEDARVVVTLTGDVDAALVDDLQQAAVDTSETGKPVVVDASGVDFIDSSGLKFLVRVATRSPEGTLTLAGPSPAFRFLLETAELTDVLRVVDEVPPAA